MPAWPSMTDVVERLRGGEAAPADEPEDEETGSEEKLEQEISTEGAGADAGDAAAQERTADADAKKPAPQTQQETKTEPSASAIVEHIRSQLKAGKSGDQIVKDLPEDVVLALGGALHKGMQRVVNTRDQTFDQRVAQTVTAAVDQAREQIRAEVQEQIDELIASGMSDEDAENFRAKRKLARIEARDNQRATASEKDTAIKAAQDRVVGEWWTIAVREGGLPADPEDPRVQELWEATFQEPDFDSAKRTLRARIAEMKATAAPRAGKPAAAADGTITISRDELTELVRKGVADTLKESGLHADTGRLGGSGSGSTKKPKTFAEAGSMALERLRSQGVRGPSSSA